jgi:hypothetical protein
MVPWASNGVADKETIGKRSVVMRAMRANREYFGAALDDQYLLVAHSSRLDTIYKLTRWDALDQVSHLVVGHHTEYRREARALPSAHYARTAA